MTTSDQIDQIATALAAAQGEISNAVKSAENPFFSRGNRKATYADLASVWDAIRGPLSKHGLALVQFPRTAYQGTPEGYEWTAKQSGETRYGVRVMTQVSVQTRLIHASGQWLEDEVSTMLPTGDSQAVGSAITYMRRYAAMSVCGVAPDDDDAEAAVGRGVSTPATTAAAAPAGYVDWLDELRKTAPQGTPALQVKWKASKVEFRDHLLRVAPKHWEAMKETAAKVTVSSAPVVS